MVTPTPYHLVQAASDRRMRSLFLAYFVLQTWLSPNEFLPLSIPAFARELHYQPKTLLRWHCVNTTRTIAMLVRLGYVVRGPKSRQRAPGSRHGAKMTTYRLQIPVSHISSAAINQAA